jgi:hypothetical protein
VAVTPDAIFAGVLCVMGGCSADGLRLLDQAIRVCWLPGAGGCFCASVRREWVTTDGRVRASSGSMVAVVIRRGAGW